MAVQLGRVSEVMFYDQIQAGERRVFVRNGASTQTTSGRNAFALMFNDTSTIGVAATTRDNFGLQKMGAFSVPHRCYRNYAPALLPSFESRQFRTALMK